MQLRLLETDAEGPRQISCVNWQRGAAERVRDAACSRARRRRWWLGNVVGAGCMSSTWIIYGMELLLRGSARDAWMRARRSLFPPKEYKCFYVNLHEAARTRALRVKRAIPNAIFKT